MVNEIKIPKDNIKKVEEIREIEEERVVASYEVEFASYGDISINRSYGPGNAPSSFDCGTSDIINNPIRKVTNEVLEKLTEEAAKKVAEEKKKEQEKKEEENKNKKQYDK